MPPKLLITAGLAALATGLIFISKNQSAQTTNLYISFEKGSLPIIISVPHDGDLEMDIPQRVNTGGYDHFHTTRDEHTREMAEVIAQKMEQSSGQRPYLVVDLLSRKYLDPNRAPNQAYENFLVEPIYRQYYQDLSQAISEIEAGGERPLLVDIHGQSQYPADVYLRSGTQKRFNLWDNRGLGTKLIALGYDASSDIPEYLNVAQIIDSFNVKAVQIEVHRRIRFDTKLEDKFTSDLVKSLLDQIKP